MTAANLPGQLELPTVIDHKSERYWKDQEWRGQDFKPQGIRLATLLRDYENRPSSETWSRIQQLAAEILK